MRAFIIGFICFAQVVLHAQAVADFENYDLSQDTFINNSGDVRFASGELEFANTYDMNYDFWTGWAISSMRDTVTPGFNNQFSAITGSGYESDAYAVGYAAQPNVISFAPDHTGEVISGMYVTNSTYAYLSMRDGDSFAKKFGGATGQDPDFFKMTFRALEDGIVGQDSVEFYLADFRSDNADDDYIIDEWTFVSLFGLGDLDSLQITLSSSDVGQFGMNTPAYFCVDDIVTDRLSSAIELNTITANLYPNPVENQLNVDVESASAVSYRISNGSGQIVRSGKSRFANLVIDTHLLEAGQYWLTIVSEEGVRTLPFSKI